MSHNGGHGGHGGHMGTTSPPGHGPDGGHGGMEGMMLNYFHFDLVDTVLFQSWKMDSSGPAVLICTAFFVLAFLYEGLKSYREYLLTGRFARNCCDQPAVPVVQQSVDNNLSVNNGDQIQPIVSPGENSHSSRHHVCQSFGAFGTTRQLSHKLLNLSHLIQSVLHMVQVAASYTLMLGFMTFNGWICLSILFGAGAGYFTFCWRRLSVVSATEHCH